MYLDADADVAIAKRVTMALALKSRMITSFIIRDMCGTIGTT